MMEKIVFALQCCPMKHCKTSIISLFGSLVKRAIETDVISWPNSQIPSWWCD